jgi:hypothetical protein
VQRYGFVFGVDVVVGDVLEVDCASMQTGCAYCAFGSVDDSVGSG